MKDYYAEYVGKKSENISETKVSKVSKGSLEDEKQAFDTFDTEHTNIKSKKNVQETVNQFIARGVVFYPNENDYSIENSELLNADEKEFLGVNQTEILYLLQFASIWKYAPEHFPTLQKQVAENPNSLYETVKSCFALCFSDNEDTEQGNKQNEVI